MGGGGTEPARGRGPSRRPSRLAEKKKKKKKVAQKRKKLRLSGMVRQGSKNGEVENSQVKKKNWPEEEDEAE